MAHASMDYHMDFISLLSLSNIGVVEPEIQLAAKKERGASQQQAGVGQLASSVPLAGTPSAAPYANSVQQVNSHNSSPCPLDLAADSPNQAIYVVKKRSRELESEQAHLEGPRSEEFRHQAKVLECLFVFSAIFTHKKQLFSHLHWALFEVCPCGG